LPDLTVTAASGKIPADDNTATAGIRESIRRDAFAIRSFFILLKINENFGFIPTVRAGGMSRYFFVSLFDAFTSCCLVPGIFFDGFKGTGDNHLSLIAAIFTGTYLAEFFLTGFCGHLPDPPLLVHSDTSAIHDGKTVRNCQILIAGIQHRWIQTGVRLTHA